MIIFDIETNGLEKRENRVTCISFCSLNSEIKTIMNEDEKELLQEFFRYLHMSSEKLLVSFNGSAFDIPFIIHRALVNKVKAPTGFVFPKHTDIRQIATGFFYSYNKYEKGTLDDWCKILGYDTKFSNGSEVAAAWDKRDLKFIQEHCEYDIFVTREIVKQLIDIGLIVPF